jgi:RNA polymerase sigma factor (sigma-70 family)
MARGQLDRMMQHLRQVVRPPTSDGLSDAQLLEHFVRRRDEAAFEALVWRHGAMVLNLCLRVLRRRQDAEDAFQATFLTLVRKAGAIGKRQSVGSWLYKVAYRVALRARATSWCRALPEQPLPDVTATDPVSELIWAEFRSLLDEEIHQLADRYRVAFVLCQL